MMMVRIDLAPEPGIQSARHCRFFVVANDRYFIINSLCFFPALLTCG